MAFYQLFHLILHEIDRFGCFMLKSGFFSKSLVLCLTNKVRKNSRYFVGVFNDTIIPFALNGYEMIIASSYPKCTHGIVTSLNKAHIKNSKMSKKWPWVLKQNMRCWLKEKSESISLFQALIIYYIIIIFCYMKRFFLLFIIFIRTPQLS